LISPAGLSSGCWCSTDGIVCGFDQSGLVRVDFTRFDQIATFLNTSLEAMSLDIKLLVFALWLVLFEVAELTFTIFWEIKDSAVAIWLTLLESTLEHPSQV